MRSTASPAAPGPVRPDPTSIAVRPARPTLSVRACRTEVAYDVVVLIAHLDEAVRENVLEKAARLLPLVQGEEGLPDLLLQLRTQIGRIGERILRHQPRFPEHVEVL